MRQVLLLRHAKSCWYDPALGDFDRPLNNRGRRNARAMAAHLRKSGLRPGLVLCSAARRTRETYDVLAAALEGIPAAFETELYEAAKPQLLERLRRLGDEVGSVLLIGHNPGLERLAAALSDGQGEDRPLSRMAEKYPTGTLATLEADVASWSALRDGACRLTGFVRPADLE